MKKQFFFLGMISMLITGQVTAGDKQIMATLQKLNIPRKDVRIFPTALPGMSVVTTNQGIFYLSNDGRFISLGPIFDTKLSVPQSLANHAVKKLIISLKETMISFKAPNEKYQVTVFTDITCGYCKKLHEQIKAYNEKGITINYLAFPREGVDSPSGKQMQLIWSAVDRKIAFDESYKGRIVESGNRIVSYIEQHYKIGRQIGITGTPTIVLANGEMINGYLSPEKLEEAILKTINR